MDITILITTEDKSKYTTYPFLRNLVPRLITDLFESEECNPCSVSHIEREDYEQGGFVGALERLVRGNSGYSIIIIHQDAEDRSQKAVIHNKFDPLFTTLQDRINDDLVKVIPVRMIEAWLCSDWETFAEVSSLNTDRDSGLFPDNPKGVERILDPKSDLNRFIREKSSTRRGRSVNISKLFEPLGKRVDINRLKRIPAFKEFRKELKNALNAINP